MRVLVTYGSKRGGTAGIAEMVAETLQQHGITASVRDTRDVGELEGFDAFVVGGALYAGRWPREAARFVKRLGKRRRDAPVWLFSSGPLDDSASSGELPPTRQVAGLMARTGARGHTTFGGRLLPDAKGFPASAMAKEHAGDWRDPGQIRRWASEIADALHLAGSR